MISVAGGASFDRRCTSSPARRAGRRAAVAGDGVAVVALLLRELEPVAAHRGARAARALRLDGAGRRAAVVRDEVAVVALLEALDLMPSPQTVLWQTDFGRRALGHAGEAGLERAGRAAAVAATCCCRRRTARCRRRCRRRTSWRCTCVSGVGHCQPGSSWQVDEQPSPETALPSSHCSLPCTLPSPHIDGARRTAGPASGRRSSARCVQVGAAAVAGDGVAVVALLADVEVDHAVAAELDLLARHARRRAGVAGLDRAGRRAAVAARSCCRRRTARRPPRMPSPQVFAGALVHGPPLPLDVGQV